MSLEEFQKKFNSSKCIEFIGMPASGKSTLMERLYSDKSKYYDVNSDLPKNKYSRFLIRFTYSLIAMLRVPNVFNDIKIIISSKQKTKRDLVIVTLNWLFISYVYNCKRKNKNVVWVLDQGLFQAIWSINFSSQKEVDYVQLLNNKNLPNKIHFTDASDGILKMRATKRDATIRLDYTNEENILRARKSLEIVLDLLDRCNYLNDGSIYWKEG